MIDHRSTEMSSKRILVIGGGAAGMLAALFAAKSGAAVTLLERNEKLGKKIYITGKGRCNLTNAAEDDEFMRAIVRNPRFLYAAFSAFSNRDMMELMRQQGVPVKIERGSRVFPESDKASDVTYGIKRAMDLYGVDVRLNTRVEQLLIENGRCIGVQLDNGASCFSDAVILATGGVSYPSTGSTGDGYRFAEEAGHSMQKARPALVPVETKESWPSVLTGLTLKNVALKAWQADAKKKKPFYHEQGEMLFTHFGISGPLVLTLSSYLPENLENVRMSIDLKPALDEQTLDARILRDFNEMIRKRIVSVMDGLVPHNLGLQILLLAGISPQTPVNTVTAAQRAELVHLLKNLPLTPKALRGFNEAIITRGGITVKEINPSTMESKLLPGLYFAGEMIDVDAQTGGFNLQIAFSTGALAGMSAAKEEE